VNKTNKEFIKVRTSLDQATATHTSRVGTYISMTTGKSCRMSLKRRRFSFNAAK